MSRAGNSAVAERPRTRTRSRAKTPAPANDEPRRKLRGSPGGGGGRGGVSGGPRPVWSGSISFGLVNIPVRLFTAVREQRVSFHLLHDQDKARLRRKTVSGLSGKDVHPEHIVRGYEVDKGKFVVVHKDELEACAPEKTRAIEITDFVKLADIDRLYYERPYYVLPQKGAARSYRLIVEAMRRSGRVGVARVVLHDKEHLAALRPVGDLLCLSTMYFQDEVVPRDPIEESVENVSPGEREVKAAEKLINAAAKPFDPSRYQDEYRDCLQKMVEKKAAKEQVVSGPVPGEEAKEKKPHAARANDLMAALEASLARAKGQAKRRKSA